MNQIVLNGRTAVITGGGRGIGLAIGRRLVSSGAKVALWDRDAARVTDASALLEGAIGISVDVTDAKSVEAAFDASEAAHGPVEILVTSAAIGGVSAAAEDYPVDVWRDVIDVNLTGVFISCRTAVKRMRRTGYGRIVNIASIAGKEGNPNSSAYSASKGGVIALTKSLGKELAETEIRVNCITPGVVQTELLKDATPAHVEYMLSKIPMKRFGTVEEMSALVAWLVSEECSFSTGAVFDISGGRATY